ncbi:MAG TPA: hypothetical protein VF584_13425 [Longimicrobium sp.]|jgi:hypothetical protein
MAPPAGPVLDRANGVTLSMAQGDGQTGLPGTPLPTLLVVRVLDQAKRPIAGAVVNWVAVSGGGSVSIRRSNTDASGYASTRWTLGAAEGEQTVRASGKGGTFLFSANRAHGVPVAMHVIPGSVWLTVGDTARLRVVFLDAEGNVVPGPRPTFKSFSHYATVDQNGVVRATQAANGGIEILAPPFRRFASVNPWSRAHERYGSPRNWLYVVPEAINILPGDTTRLHALWVDGNGAVSNARDAAWSSLSPSTATVLPGGKVTAVRDWGGAAIYARRSDRVGRSDVGVTRPQGWYPGLILTGVTISSATVRAGASVGWVTFSVYYITDGPARLSRFTVQLRAPDGTTREQSWNGSSGTMRMPKGSAPGRYDIVKVTLTDNLGKSDYVVASQLQSRGSPTYFTVVR